MPHESAFLRGSQGLSLSYRANTHSNCIKKDFIREALRVKLSGSLMRSTGKTMKKTVLYPLYSVLIAFALFGHGAVSTLAQTAVTPPGDGLSRATAYQISELGHLVWMKGNVSTSQGKYYLLVSDIDAIATAAWNDSNTSTTVMEGLKPIGTRLAPFKGVFDGQGKSIRNLYIVRTNESEIGLFGAISNTAVICNLRIENCHIQGMDVIGGVVGWSSGTITNCYTTGWIKGGAFVGGVAANNATAWQVQNGITNKYMGTIGQCGSSAQVYGEKYVGGVCGANAGAINECCALGPVTGGISSSILGGLTGGNDKGIIQRSYATSRVMGWHVVGGLVGRNGTLGSIAQCFSVGLATGSGDVGGLVGLNYTNAEISASFWNLDLMGSTVSSNGIARTAAEMFQQTNYVDWDFTNTWRIAEGISYPSLRWEPSFFTLAMECQGPGSIQILPQKETYEPGEMVSITATPSAGNVEFVRWEGPGVADVGLQTTTVGMDCTKSIRAVFRTACALSSVDDLRQIGANPGYTLDGRYWLTQDIDLAADASFTGIGGTNSLAFTGSFDGQGHRILNFTSRQTNSVCVGLFSQIGTDGTVRNLGLVGCDVMGKDQVGGLAGMNKGSVTNCYCQGTIAGGWDVGGLVGLNYGMVVDDHTSGTVSGTDKVGGLIGRNEDGAVVRCYSTVNMPCSAESGCVGGLIGWNTRGSISDGSATGEITGGSYVGGLLGYNWGGQMVRCQATNLVVHAEYTSGGLIAFNDAGNIDQSSTSGTVSGTDTVGGLVGINNGGDISSSDTTVTVTGEEECGGLVGFHYAGTLEACSTTQQVTGKVDVGGLVGCNYDQGVITNCTATGTVQGTNSVGGLVGYNSGALQECRASGQVSGSENVGGLIGENFNGNVVDAQASGSVRGQNTVGGLVGMNSGSILEANANTTVTGEWWSGGVVGLNFHGSVAKCNGGGDVAAEWDAGGLMGENFFGTVHQSSASGTVTGDYQTGGLLGDNYGGQVTQSYASGIVSGGSHGGGLVGENYYGGFIAECYATGPVTGNSGVGGLVGYHGGYSTNTVIRDCYAVGDACSSSPQSGGLVGIIQTHIRDSVAQPDGIVEASYWNLEAAGPVVSTNGIGKTSAEMMQRNTFAGWDFDTTWTIVEGKSFPQLRWAPSVLSVKVVGKGPGSVTISPEQAGYAAGDTLTLTATPQTGDYEFAGWVGARVTDPKAATITVTADIQKNIQAVFRPARAIASLEDLAKIGRDPAFGLEGRYWLTQDIDATESANWNDAGTDESILEGFTPIGTETTPFTGTFDGKGHIIRNFTILRASQDYVGLFGYLGNQAMVTNVVLENAAVVGQQYVGGLVGDNWAGMISSCRVNGMVSGTYSVGGLVGMNHQYIIKCQTKGTVMGRNEAYKPYSSNIGGLVGYGEDDVVDRSLAETEVKGYNNAGGLVGTGYGSAITQCHVDIPYTGITNRIWSGAGGLVGSVVNCDIQDCYVIGDVYASYYAGGVAGYAANSVIRNCYTVGSGHSSPNAGGVAGFGFYMMSPVSEVINSYWDVETSGLTNSAGGIGKTTAEMKLAETYTGWDWTNVWGLDPTKNNGYPYLRALEGETILVPPGLAENEQAACLAWVTTNHTAWGQSDFSQMPVADFATAYLMDVMPATGVAATVQFQLKQVSTGPDGIGLGLSLTIGTTPKQGGLHGWLIVEGCRELSGSWEVVVSRKLDEQPISFESGVARLNLPQTEHHFYRARIASQQGQ